MTKAKVGQDPIMMNADKTILFLCLSLRRQLGA